MSVMLATLCLNEMEWLPQLYKQHSNWPEMTKWVFVESADVYYAKANPDLVSRDGLSVDGTSDFLLDLSKKDSRIQYIPYGFSSHVDPAEGKVSARNQYAAVAEDVSPEILIVVDADEFYPNKSQLGVLEVVRSNVEHIAFVFRQREIWRPPSIAEQPLFQYEVSGVFWGISHCRVWRWRNGLRYFSHNHLEEFRGQYRSDNVVRMEYPQYVHMAFASNSAMRLAKNRYYVERGEGVTDHRQKYVTCRDAYRTWKPGATLPRGAVVSLYTGEIPEVFR